MPAELDSIRDGIKTSLKKQFPNLKDDELERRSWAMAVSAFKKKHGKLPSSEESVFKFDVDSLIKESKRYDSEGRIIVAENVPVVFESNIKLMKE